MPSSASASDARVRFLRAFGCAVLEDRLKASVATWGLVANEARTTSLIICSEHNEVRVAIDRRQMRRVRRVDIVKCLMKNDKKVDD